MSQSYNIPVVSAAYDQPAREGKPTSREALSNVFDRRIQVEGIFYSNTS